MLATSSMPGGRATRRRGRRQATIHGGVGATIAERTRVFSREIRTTSFTQSFRQPTSIVKYTGKTDPRIWLNDYRLACQLGGDTTDEVIIRNLPLHLADSAWTWLKHLPASDIHNWTT
jgi:hypothetical protein